MGDFSCGPKIFAHQGEHLRYRAGLLSSCQPILIPKIHRLSLTSSIPKDRNEERSRGRGLEMGDRKITILSVTADNGYSVSGCLNWVI